MGPQPKQTEVPRHAEHEERAGECDTGEELALLRPDLCRARNCFDVFQLLLTCEDDAVPGTLDSRRHLFEADRARGESHGGPFRGVVDRGGLDARSLAQRPLDCGDAVGARHSRNGKDGFARFSDRAVQHALRGAW